MNDIRNEPPVEDPVEDGIDTSKIEVDKDDFDELVDQLEYYASKETKEQTIVVLSKTFWDNWFAKLFASLVSVKIWILFWVLYIPYELVQRKLISGDNYTSIIIIVAPLVIGLREYSKVIASKTESALGSDLIKKIRDRFKI